MMLTRPSVGRQFGLSLLELIIVLALSSILTLGVIEFFSASRQTIATIHDRNELLDNAQLAQSLLQDSIHMAGYWGGVDGDAIEIRSSGLKSYPGDCNAAWVLNLSTSLQGFEGKERASDIAGLPTGCLSHDYVPESDVLLVRYADPREEFADHLLDNKHNAKHYFIRTLIGEDGVVFKGAHSTQVLSSEVSPGRPVTRQLRVNLFFVERCNNSAVCSDRGATLSRYTLSGNRFYKQRLIDGIAQMQLEYGIDSDQDRRVDNYVLADQVQDWQAVYSVRIYLLVQGQLSDLSDEGVADSYPLGRLSDYHFQPEQASLFLRYQTYQSEVQLKNRVQ